MFANKKLLKTGIYRAFTDISKLQLRLTIHKIHSLIDVPVLESRSKDLKNEAQTESGSKETRTIRWQEKIFSRYEMDYYVLKENCQSEHQKIYHNRIKSENHEPDILFTYVEGDNYFPDDSDNQSRYTSSQVSDNNTKSMYLMADLGQDVLLFSIHWFPDERLMFVYPDFNQLAINPYYQEVRGSNLQMYHYALEKYNSIEQDIPKPSSTMAVIDGISKTTVSLPLAREKRFIMPKQLYRNLLILLEIVSATAFKYDEMHIRYQIELPSGVKNVEGSRKAVLGSTQASKNLNGCWQFGHCHELLLMIPESKEAQLPKIELFLEAISIDNWQRERYLGQSHLSIPLRPQKTELTLSFVQLTNSDALSDRLETFLVGNRRKVDLISFYSKNDRNFLNRYGNETSVSGELLVRYQTLRQHQPKVLNEGFFKAAKKSKNITLKELIATYTAARERLEEFVELQY